MVGAPPPENRYSLGEESIQDNMARWRRGLSAWQQSRDLASVTLHSREEIVRQRKIQTVFRAEAERQEREVRRKAEHAYLSSQKKSITPREQHDYNAPKNKYPGTREHTLSLSDPDPMEA